jgi:predicted permease
MFLHPDMDGPILAIAGLLAAIVALVLLVACVNLAGFLLARGMERRREVGIRLALGAGRGQVVRQLMLESWLLGVAGGAVGLVLGIATARALASIELPIPIDLDLGIGLDPTVLAVTTGVSLLAGLLFGLAPALQASRTPVGSVLREEGNAVAGGGRRIDLRGFLVAGQLALSVVLLVGAGLFARSLAAAGRVDPGFDTGAAAILEVQGGGAGYTSGSELLPVLEAALRDLEQRPDVDHAALVTRLPLDLGSWVEFFEVPGVDPPPGRDYHRIEFNTVSPGYLDAMDIGLLEGRPFSAADRAGNAPVALVSRALAGRFWPGESAVGRTLIPTSQRDETVTVVGVVDDVKVWSLQEPPRPYLYRPFAQNPSTFANLVLRGALPPSTLGRHATEALQRADPDLFVASMTDMSEHLGYTLFLPRMGALLVGAVALLALLLSSIGLWGIVSYGVARRTREMGIRMSLGAGVASVVGLVVRQGLVLAGVGAVLGLGASLLLGRLLEPYLIGVGALDAVTLVGVPLLLLAVVSVAALIPARRAARVDPVEALRTE